MKKLPQYFVILADKDNPLWLKYINWLNETYDQNLTGRSWNYYGYDGCIEYWDRIEDFENNPKLISLEEWNECVNEIKEEQKGYFTYQNWTL